MTTSPNTFNSLDPQLMSKRKQVQELCRQFNRSPSKGNLKRLKSIFHSVGDEVFIESGFMCDYGDMISLGHRVYININCTMLDGGRIDIANDCLIGPNVQIITINHDITPEHRLKKLSITQDVIIKDNVWIGAGSIILPGVHIGEGAIIGAGSVVTSNVEANMLYAGNPAKKIRPLEN